MIRLVDRIAAVVSCFAIGCIVVGAKSSAVVLAVWTIVSLTSARLDHRWRDQLSSILQPSPTALAFLMFALFAILSAMWSRNPSAAAKAGILLVVILIAAQFLMVALRRLTPKAAVLVARWVVIGFVGGSLILLEEFKSDFLITTYIFDTVPSLRPSKNSMIVVDGDQIASIAKGFGNWNVAAMNVALWPVLLLLSGLTQGWLRIALALAVTAVCATITFQSDHQTSQLAICFSAIVFGGAHYCSKATRRSAIAALIALVLGVIPLSQIAFERLELQNAEWAQPSLRERFKIWGHVAEAIPRAPILGIGANNTTSLETGSETLDRPQDARRHHPHNMILQTWLELGLVGVILLSLGLLGTVQALSRLSDNVLPFGYGTLCVIVVQSAATWSLWSLWFQAVVVIACCLLVLGNRLADIHVYRKRYAHGTYSKFAEL